jgi:hypothetical protein
MGWINRELITTHHSARRYATELVEVLRGPAHRRPDALTAIGEVARLTRANWVSERRAVLAQRQADEFQGRELAAESAAEQAERRATSLEQQLARADALLSTRRVRAGLALGSALDRVRHRR